LVAQAPARAEAGDKIFRGGGTYTIPWTDAEWGGIGQTDSLDPRFPPLGRLDSLEQHRTAAGNGFGVGFGFEYMLTDLVGIDTNINYSKHETSTVFSGDVTFTPLAGDPPALAPELSEYAPIIGTGAGEAGFTTITVGANLHVLRRGKVDLYLGPVAGIALLNSELTSGSFTAAFPSFVSATPTQSAEWKQQIVSDFVFGAALGIDIEMGRDGWYLSIATKYLVGSISPWTIQFGLGYRF
jgi:outer membrane protein W